MYCTDEYASVLLKLEYPDGQPVILDEGKVFWVSENRYLGNGSGSLYEPRSSGSYYLIVNDGMRSELENRQEIMRFTGYLKGEVVCERNILVSADCCHVLYSGTEPLTQIIPK